MPATPREQYEAAQRRRLAAYAVTEADGGKRDHREPADPNRTCFQRDRDRIIHSTAFRRLDSKTQVFVPHEHDHFRTRLTHSIEVAQIARDVGRALALNEDLIEAAALAHDLGHPPFGHTGEEALAELVTDYGGFEHNRQSLRVVDYLEHPYPQFRGLNLTRAVRECLAKHETAYDRPAVEEFAGTGLAPLEGQVVDLADEIAYTSADAEDALGVGWVTAEQLGKLALWRRAWGAAAEEYPDARPIHLQIRAAKNVLALMADNAVATTAMLIEAHGVKSADDVRSLDEKLAAFSDGLAPAVKEMQAFLLETVYRHEVSLAEDARGRESIRELFAAYVADPSRLPDRYERRVAEQGVERVACDYIAGMTDRFCRAEHARICG